MMNIKVNINDVCFVWKKEWTGYPKGLNILRRCRNCCLYPCLFSLLSIVAATLFVFGKFG